MCDLQRKLEQLRGEAETLDGRERWQWELERARELIENAYHAACEREFLETLVNSRVAREHCDGLADLVVFALSYAIVYNGTPESERRFSEPRLGRVVEGREAGVVWMEHVCRSGWRPNQVMEIAFLAIDAYRDRRARDSLLELASKQYEGELRRWFPMLGWPLLVNYEGAGALRPDFEKAIEAAAAVSSHQGSVMIEAEQRRLHYDDE